MVQVGVGVSSDSWFGVAWDSDGYVATALGSDRVAALEAVCRCLPNGTAYEVAQESDRFPAGAAEMLARLERGDESGKRFSISRNHRSLPMRRILTAASAIPIGYVSTYGRIARSVGSEARAVGRAMACNPLYPIVPCHRVVGAGMRLVGYGGRQDSEALSAKLARIAAETRGIPGPKEIEVLDGVLELLPAEWVVRASERAEDLRAARDRRRAEDRVVDGMQSRLFE